MTRVKICGITRVPDAVAAAEAGADMIGLVFADSPRRVRGDVAREIVQALPPSLVSVGVFLDAPVGEVQDAIESTQIDEVQLHGEETWREFAFLNRSIIKRFNVQPDSSTAGLEHRIAEWGRRLSACLLDPGAGDGKPFDWRIAHDLPARVFIAGGLTPKNVAEAIRIARPYGVDVSSGVESSPGIKDHAKMRAFIQAVREEDARHTA